MPRYIKRADVPFISEIVEKVDDRILQGVEIAGISYIVNKYQGKKSNMNKAVMVGVLSAINEYVLRNYL